MPTDVILGCHLTGIYDVNRNELLVEDDYGLVEAWLESLNQLKLYGKLFHNHFSENTLAKYENKYVEFIKVKYDTRYSPNVYRYFLYQNYLQNNSNSIDHLFFTDVSDVVVVKNPFTDPLFLNNPQTLFCGDEPKPLNNVWMLEHSAHLRAQIKDFTQYEEKFQHETLLNCGVAGGSLETMTLLLHRLCNTHQQYNQNNPTAYTGDMGVFNYVVRTHFNNKLYHGAPCNTVFKSYETHRSDCWFRHK
ncbi:MAG: hypothetical protein IT270_06245 [Saprospiraceae bacterium]|nr:hypothetical protein [Saprospiraceae bacterium]